MKSYVISYVSLFENIMHQNVTVGENELDALKEYLEDIGYIEEGFECDDVKQLTGYLWNQDIIVGILEI